MPLLIAYGVLAIGVSFLCSMLEASLLSLPRSYIEAQAERGSRVGKMLRKMKANIDRPLAAILTLNTVAHTVGAAGVGAQAAVVWNSSAVGIASGVMTLLILIFSEIIPKTLGAVYAKRLLAFTALTTRGMIVICLPLILILESINKLIGVKRESASIQRGELIATLRLGQDSGALDRQESRIISNLIKLDTLTVAEIHTPRTVVFALDADQSVSKVMSERSPIRFARIPVYHESFDHTIGYVTRFDLHQALADDRGATSLRDMIKPLEAIPEVTPVAQALQRMLQHRWHIALVTDEDGKAEGVVTLEDVLESLLGIEIVDETDPAVDMQFLAHRAK